MEHRVEWTAASPIRPALTSAADPSVRRAFTRPSLLRFASDSFMDDFVGMLDVDPMRLGELTARPETWRGPAALVTATPAAPSFARSLQRKRLSMLRTASRGAATVAAPAAAGRAPVLKLYQPAHQRYYLVAASLVCQLPGLPDRAIDAAQEERATFVVRRLLPKSGVTRPTTDPATADEYAFVNDGSSHGWRAVAASGAAAVVAGEEQLPLSPATYRADDGLTRRVLTGLVPVSRREAYLGTPRRDQQAAPVAANPPPDPRMTLLQQQVSEPWRQIVARASAVEAILSKARDGSPEPNQTEREKTRQEGRDEIQTVSWYVLLDLARFLEAHLPNVWAALTGTAASLSPAEAAIVSAIDATTYTRDSVTRTLRSTLAALRAREVQLERVAVPYTEGSSAWPSELFPLAAIRSTEQLNPKPGDFVLPSPVERVSGLTPATLESLVRAALPAAASAPVPVAPIASRPPLAAADPGWFVIRCVYERPQCGPLAPPVVSEPSEVFQLAAFFDPDAPARPIRIGLPADVSPAGLRKFDKNTAFMVSDMLCGHIQRMKGLTLGDLVRSVLPWPLHKDLPVSGGPPCSDAAGSVGMMLSISLPIVTIAALMMLMIIVNLLDIVFRWMPYFMVTFPIPGFKAKENA
jgi:hypothetical protein